MGLSTAVLGHTTELMAVLDSRSSPLLASTEAAAAEAAAAIADNSLLPFLPRWLKLVLLLVFILNARSLPGIWHARIWWHALVPHLQSKWRGMLPHLRIQHESNGSDPLRLKSTRHLWAGPDDCDSAFVSVQVNLHLSNSCYAKHCDASRMKAIVDWFGPFLIVGGWAGLAGAHYVFPREIKALATYDIEFTIGGYGDKWIYITGTFVGGPDNRRPSSSSSSSSVDVDAGFRASLGKPIKEGQASLDVPLLSPTSPGSSSGNATPLPRREDGRIVHCVSVSQYCFKLGRLTIPPAVVLAFCGYGARTNWERFERLYRQGPRAMKDWLRSGWRAHPDVGRDEYDAVGRLRGRKGEDMHQLLAAFGTQ